MERFNYKSRDSSVKKLGRENFISRDKVKKWLTFLSSFVALLFAMLKIPLPRIKQYRMKYIAN